MKLIYSHLQKFLPTLDVKPQQLRDDLTMIGHFTNYFEEIENDSKRGQKLLSEFVDYIFNINNITKELL